MKGETMSGMMHDVRERARDRMVTARLTSMDRENERLRTERSMLRAELERERQDGDQLRDALKTSAKKRAVKVRRPGPLRMLILAVGAYLLGARAGRERYDEIRSWALGLQRRYLTGSRDLAGSAS